MRYIAATSLAFFGLAAGVVWKLDRWIARKLGVRP